MDSIKERVETMNTKILLAAFLLLTSLLFLVMVFLVYHAIQKEVIVSAVMATSFMAIMLNTLTLIGNHCDNYFIVTLFFWTTLVHILVNFIISIKFALLFLALFSQICSAIIAFIHIRRIKQKQFLKVAQKSYEMDSKDFEP